MKPLISIVLNIYNLEFEYVKRSIDSIKEQNFNNYECLIIDDGSSDKFKYGDFFRGILKDKRFKYYYQKNQGISIARNNGIKKSNGEYVFFLDGDDYLTPNILEEFSKKIKEFDFDVMHTNYIETSKNKKANKKEIKTNFVSNGELCNLIWFDQTQNMKFLIKRAFIDEHNLFFPSSNKRHEDVYWALIIKIKMKNYLYTNIDSFFYDDERNNSFTNTTKFSNDSPLFIDMILDVYKDILGNDEFINKFMYYVIYYIAKFLYTDYRREEWKDFFDKKINIYLNDKKFITKKYKILLMIYKNNILKFFIKPFINNDKLRKFVVKKIK